MGDEKGGGKMPEKGMRNKGGPGKPMPDKGMGGGRIGKGGGQDTGGGKK